MIHILAISGSLRKASSNTALLKAASTLAPKGVEISLYKELESLPLFNPDFTGFEPPSVMDFRDKLLKADGILIASPEYVHGITGVLKNALDWVVASEEFIGKPVGLLNASSRATIAYDSLKEIITTMTARIIPEASVVVPLPNNKIDEAGIIAHPELSRILLEAVLALKSEIERSEKYQNRSTGF